MYCECEQQSLPFCTTIQSSSSTMKGHAFRCPKGGTTIRVKCAHGRGGWGLGKWAYHVTIKMILWLNCCSDRYLVCTDGTSIYRPSRLQKCNHGHLALLPRCRRMPRQASRDKSIWRPCSNRIMLPALGTDFYGYCMICDVAWHPTLKIVRSVQFHVFRGETSLNISHDSVERAAPVYDQLFSYPGQRKVLYLAD